MDSCGGLKLLKNLGFDGIIGGQRGGSTHENSWGAKSANGCILFDEITASSIKRTEIHQFFR